MGRPVLLVLLALGSLAGFGAAFAGWRHHEDGWGAAWRERRLDAVADACVRAAERVNAARSSPAAPPAPPPNGAL
jgi:hypothetical protein